MSSGGDHANRPASDEALVSSIFGIGDHVRYVAIGDGPAVDMRERAGLSAASSSDSDRYEELLVNPALLLLTRQRGDIDCGGLRYVVVRYGNFFQVVVPRGAGHVSVAVEPHADPSAVAEAVVGLVAPSPG
ncbi:MAG TPA: hypothetical protein VFZ77_10390 [Acidimicrobiales bacterium]